MRQPQLAILVYMKLNICVDIYKYLLVYVKINKPSCSNTKITYINWPYITAFFYCLLRLLPQAKGILKKKKLKMFTQQWVSNKVLRNICRPMSKDKKIINRVLLMQL